MSMFVAALTKKLLTFDEMIEGYSGYFPTAESMDIQCHLQFTHEGDGEYFLHLLRATAPGIEERNAMLVLCNGIYPEDTESQEWELEQGNVLAILIAFAEHFATTLLQLDMILDGNTVFRIEGIDNKQLANHMSALVRRTMRVVS